MIHWIVVLAKFLKNMDRRLQFGCSLEYLDSGHYHLSAYIKAPSQNCEALLLALFGGLVTIATLIYLR
jgi:hypothetical protein